MGGMGFIHSAECEIMHNSVLINVHMTHAAAEMGVPRYFFSSSVCVYRDMKPGEPEMTEAQAIPAHPDNEYGWEKLYSERGQAYGRHYGMKVRIARFQNCYGPEGTWTGGREKAPAAICRKVAEVEDGGTIPVWGDGTAVRSYTYVDDMVDGIYRLMHSDLEGAANIGNPEYVTVKELVDMVAEVAGKRINVEWVKGPVGVQSRNFSNERIYSLGWRAQVPLSARDRVTYPWIEEQVTEGGDRRRSDWISGNLLAWDFAAWHLDHQNCPDLGSEDQHHEFKRLIDNPESLAEARSWLSPTTRAARSTLA